MANNTVTSNAIASLYNVDINYDFYGNEVSFKHIELLPAGRLSEPIQVFPTSGTVSKVAWDEPIATMKPIHQSDMVRGYKGTTLKLSESGQWKTFGTHRLVHFADNSEWSNKSEGTVIHHIDGNPTNNRAENLMLTTNSANVLRFFRGADNQSEIANQQYKDDIIAKGITALTYDGKQYPDYYITRDGQVFHYVEGERVPVKTFVANKKYPTNHNLKISNKTMSLHKLMAQNYLIVPQGKYKTLMIDPAIANPYQPQNLYTVPVKKF